MLRLRTAFKLLALIAPTLMLLLFLSSSLVLLLFLLSVVRLCGKNCQFIILEIEQIHQIKLEYLSYLGEALKRLGVSPLSCYQQVYPRFLS